MAGQLRNHVNLFLSRCFSLIFSKAMWNCRGNVLEILRSLKMKQQFLRGLIKNIREYGLIFKKVWSRTQIAWCFKLPIDFAKYCWKRVGVRKKKMSSWTRAVSRNLPYQMSSEIGLDSILSFIRFLIPIVAGSFHTNINICLRIKAELSNKRSDVLKRLAPCTES